MLSDARAYSHWPWSWAELDGEQRFAVECGVAGHCSRTALQQDGSAGLHTEPVVVLDFASLYPSVFIAHNLCYSTLLPPRAHEHARLSHHRTPNTVGPNTRVPRAVGVSDTRQWSGDAIAFVSKEQHLGLLPRLLAALLQQRRAVKARIKELRTPAMAAVSTNSYLAAVLDARQLTLKLLSNASYGFTGADTSHLCCKPLAEACLRFGNHWTRTASELIEAQGAGHDPLADVSGNTAPRFPGAAVIYANTDSLFVKLPGRTPAQAVAEGKAMAEYISAHARLPGALTLEFERVLSPCLLDAHNRYAGAEFVNGNEKPTLHQKGLVERRQCRFVGDVLRGALERLLIEGDQNAALDYCARMAKELLSGEVSAHLLLEGGFLKRANQHDLLRMAGMSKDEKKIDRATREADESLRKENTVSLAIELLKRGATPNGRPTVVFRQGEYVPFIAVRRSGGSGAIKQFENIAPLEEAIMSGTPVDLRLLYERRLLPALIGQVKEASGKATKEAAEPDRPALIGRIMTAKARQEFRFGAHSRKSSAGVLAAEGSWRFYGLATPPVEAISQKKGGQGKIQSFFGGGKRASASSEAGAVNFCDPPTPSTDEDNADEVTRWEREVTQLTNARHAIHVAAGGQEGDQHILFNHSAALANATRQLESARRKTNSAQRGSATPTRHAGN